MGRPSLSCWFQGSVSAYSLCLPSRASPQAPVCSYAAMPRISVGLSSCRSQYSRGAGAARRRIPGLRQRLHQHLRQPTPLELSTRTSAREMASLMSTASRRLDNGLSSDMRLARQAKMTAARSSRAAPSSAVAASAKLPTRAAWAGSAPCLCRAGRLRRHATPQAHAPLAARCRTALR